MSTKNTRSKSTSTGRAKATVTKPKSAERKPVLADLGLQGGGAHGAFTWGVLDRLLEEPWLSYDGISGTSAGAMNAAVMVDGYAAGGADGARQALERFWKAVSDAAALSPFRRGPMEVITGNWTLDYSPMFVALDVAARLISPYDIAPHSANPARADPGELHRLRAPEAGADQAVRHRHQRAHRARPPFRNADVSPDALLASACLPTMFQAVEIDGEAYWDGGYSGNPSIAPLIRECSSRDTILVQINPIERPGTPRTAREIHNRLNEIAFNSTLIKELRAAALLRRVADPGTGDGAAGSRRCAAPDRQRRDALARLLVEDARGVELLPDAARRRPQAADAFLRGARRRPGRALDARHRRVPRRGLTPWACSASCSALAVLMWLSFRGWSVLLLAPAAALLVAAFSRAAARALDPYLHGFGRRLRGAVLPAVPARRPVRQADGGQRLGVRHRALHDRETRRAPRHPRRRARRGAGDLRRGQPVRGVLRHRADGRGAVPAADIPRRLMPAAIALGTTTFTMTAMPGTPAIQNAIPMPFFGTTPFAAPGIGLIASLIMLAFGLAWLRFAEASARRAGARLRRCRGGGRTGDRRPAGSRARDDAGAFDPPEAAKGRPSADEPGIGTALAPLVVMIGVNLLMSFVVLPRLDFAFADERPLAFALRLGGQRRLVGTRRPGVRDGGPAAAEPSAPGVGRESMDAGANASVLPVLSVASLVGFGAIVAAMPAFADVRDWILGIEGGLLVSLSVDQRAGGADRLGVRRHDDRARCAGGDVPCARRATGIDPALLHRIAAIGAGTLDSLPHNGAVVTLLAVCRSSHRESYFHIAMTAIVGPIVALVAVIVLAGLFGSF
jgi:NTE family protein